MTWLRRRLQLFPVLWLTALWALFWGEITFANILSGLVLAVLVLVVFPLPRLITGVRLRLWAFVVLVVRFVADVVVASFEVAWMAVRPGGVPRSSVVTIPLRSRNELFHTLVGVLMSLVPGSFVINLDSTRGLLSMHVIDVKTPEEADGFRRRVLQQEDRVLRALAAEPSRTTAGAS